MQINSVAFNNRIGQNFNGTLRLPTLNDDTLEINTDEITHITDKNAKFQCTWIDYSKKAVMTRVPIEKVLTAYAAASQNPDITIELTRLI